MPSASRPSHRRTPWVLLLLIAALAVGAAGYLLLAPGAHRLQTGILLPQPRSVDPFVLANAAGGQLTNADLKDHWTLLYTGYTHCPDVCPTTLTALSQVFKHLGRDRARIQLWFISVDPRRDNPKLLLSYAHAFDPAFIGATADVPALKAMGQNLGFAFSYGPPIGGDPDQYEVNHSAGMILINPHGELAGYFNPPIQINAMANDLRHVIDGTAATAQARE